MKPSLNKRNINFALHNPSTVLRLVAGRLNYEKTLQARVSRDLGFIRSHALKEGTERNFVGLSQDEIDKKLRLITPAKTESSWRLSGQTSNPEAILSLDQELAWQVFTKAIDPQSAAQQVQITGDRALALPVLSLVAVLA